MLEVSLRIFQVFFFVTTTQMVKMIKLLKARVDAVTLWAPACLSLTCNVTALPA